MARLNLKDSDFLKKMRDRYKLADDADLDQAQRERSDIAFEDGDQWPADIKLSRMGQQPQAGQPAVPSRPTLVIDKVKEPVRQILNQERQADLGVELVPADDFGDLSITPDDTEVTLREGLIRRIQRDSKAADARSWAFKRAVIAGRGYYMVALRYLPGKTFDQEIYVHRIYNQSAVLLDPSHEAPDGSDADWAFIGTWMPWDRFKASYPKDVSGKDSPFLDYGDNDFMTLTEEYPTWYRSEKEQHAVRIVDYWYTEHVARTVVEMPDGTTAYQDELPEDTSIEGLRTRTSIEKRIKFCKIAGGFMELEKTDWPGPDMPIVKVVGDEVLPYDAQRRYNGVVRPARDSQQSFNYMISKFVEQIGLSPIPLLQLDPEAIDGYEQFYDVLNVRTVPYAPYRTYDDDGRQLNQPTRLPVDPHVQAVAQGVSIFDQMIKSTTAVPDSTLGNVDPSLKSGRAIREVVANAQLSTSNFMDNLARSIRYEGQIINNLLYPVLGQKPQRLVRILTGEGENQTMAVYDPEQTSQVDAQLRQKAAKVAKLTKDAKFNVIVKVAKRSEDRRQQFVEMFGNILSADPTQMAVGGDLFYKNMDIPEARELSKRQKAMLAPPVQKMLADQEQGIEISPAAQAQMAQMQAQMQQMELAMQDLSQKASDNATKLQIEQMRAQLELQKADLQFQRDVELQRMKDATELAKAHIAAANDTIAAEDEAKALAMTQAHEAAQAAMDRQHEAEMGLQDKTHEVEMGMAAIPANEGAE